MNKDTPAPKAHEDASARREFLRKSLMLVPAAMFGSATPAVAAIMSGNYPAQRASAAYAPPVRARGSTVLNVKNFGAYGDGSHDDTNAIQSAINALPADGGTVYVPAGTYRIDAVRRVNLRSRMHLQLASGAKLAAIANAEERSYLLLAMKVSDVEISGGQIVGERDGHLGSSGQWGHGIMLRGAVGVTVRDLHVSKCWGDGVCVASAMMPAGQPPKMSNDVILYNIVSTANRRHALTIAGGRDVQVYDSELSASSGVSFPACGIDIEVDPGDPLAYHIHIENCLIRNNQGNGVEVHAGVSGIVVQDCTIENNYGYGVVALGVPDGYIARNDIRNNGLAGVAMRPGTHNYQISRNRFYNDCTRFRTKPLPPPQAQPTVLEGAVFAGHTEVASGAYDIRITPNYYYDGDALSR